jgi:hypothetical protein
LAAPCTEFLYGSGRFTTSEKLCCYNLTPCLGARPLRCYIRLGRGYGISSLDILCKHDGGQCPRSKHSGDDVGLAPSGATGFSYDAGRGPSQTTGFSNYPGLGPSASIRNEAGLGPFTAATWLRRLARTPAHSSLHSLPRGAGRGLCWATGSFSFMADICNSAQPTLFATRVEA